MTQPSHVFIVGSGRAGTTLVRYALNRSEDIAISGETRFLNDGPFRRGFQHKFARAGDMSTDAGARRVVDFIFHGLRDGAFWSWVKENVAQEQFLDRLLESGRTDRALLDLAIKAYAGGKAVRGEKTPAHIYSLPTLIEWFPEAKFIHMMRDPRAVFASSKAAKKRSDARREHLIGATEPVLTLWVGVAVTKVWLDCARLHQRYRNAYPQNYYLLRFEDLIAEPRARLTKLCNFLEIDFVEEMLQQIVVNSNILPRTAEVRGFNTAAIDGWRNQVHPWVSQWYATCCKKQLLEFGYAVR